MDHQTPEMHDPELQRIGDRLRADRDQLTPLELDRIKTSVLARARVPERAGAAGRRVTAVAAICLGVLAGSAGAAFGVAALADDGSSAAVVQYGPADNPNQGEVLGESGGGSRDPSGENGDRGEVEAASGQGTAARSVQARRQVATARDGSADALPFTGYLAIPALAAGLLLTGTGLLLRRRLDASGS